MQLNKQLNALETEVLSEVLADDLMFETAQISREVRLSGSPEELRAFEYAKSRLEGWGLTTKLLFHDGYVSWPGSASLTVSGIGDVACITYAMATGTPGLKADLVYVGAGMPQDYAGVDVSGKAVLIDGISAPGKVRLATSLGSVAQIFINDANFHEGIISWIWGNPTLEQLKEMPSTPVVSVKLPDGGRIKAALANGPVTIDLKTEVDTRWRKLPVLEAELPGTAEDAFVLLSGHIDSWHLGAMDNGSANATMMTVGRILSKYRHQLKRGLRICFWSGHSHGRYCGSAWYADEKWDELRRRCVAHVNCDAVGGKGGDVISQSFAMAETKELGHAVIHGQTGVVFEGARPNRSGDQSFLGIGIPSLLMLLSEPGYNDSAAALGMPPGPTGVHPWWHTIHDTMENLDPELLARDCRIYLGTVFRLCAEAVLPFNYAASAQEYAGLLRSYQDAAKDRFDLSPALTLAATLVAKATQFEADAEQVRAALSAGEAVPADRVADLNRRMLALGRALIGTNYTLAGPFGQDYALNPPPIPPLAPIHQLVKADADAARHITVGLLRGRNRVCHALAEAVQALS